MKKLGDIDQLPKLRDVRPPVFKGTDRFLAKGIPSILAAQHGEQSRADCWTERRLPLSCYGQ